MRRRKTITPEELTELRKLGRLQRLKIYSELIRKLSAGESAAVVARWAMKAGADGPGGSWSWFSWHRHIRSLKKSVDSATKKLVHDDYRARRAAPKVPEAEAVELQVEATAADMIFADFAPSSTKKILRDLTRAIKSINEEESLKLTFVRQLEQVERYMEMEESTGIPTEATTKALSMLSKIGVKLFNMEYKERLREANNKR